MRFNPDAYTAYPILRPNSSDYLGGEFDAILHAADDCASKTLKFDLDFRISEPTVKSQVAEGNAICCAQVYCAATCYTTMLEANSSSMSIRAEIPRDFLRGLVEVHPSVITVRDIQLPLDKAHPKYGGGSMLVGKYKQLASAIPKKHSVDTKRILNDRGLLALNQMAKDVPRMFMQANPDALMERVRQEAETDDIWGAPLDLKADISSLNANDLGGPANDAKYAKTVRAALGHLPSSEGHDPNLWATINCFVIPQYVATRWPYRYKYRDDDEHRRLTSFVERHWLNGQLASARQDNAIARLWWLVEFSKRAAAYSDVYDADDLLHAMANNVTLYHQFLARPHLLSRSVLSAAVYEMFLDGNNHLRSMDYANPLMQSLNFMADNVSLDLMNPIELREAVEEAKQRCELPTGKQNRYNSPT